MIAVRPISALFGMFLSPINGINSSPADASSAGGAKPRACRLNLEPLDDAVEGQFIGGLSFEVSFHTAGHGFHDQLVDA